MKGRIVSNLLSPVNVLMLSISTASSSIQWDFIPPTVLIPRTSDFTQNYFPSFTMHPGHSNSKGWITGLSHLSHQLSQFLKISLFLCVSLYNLEELTYLMYRYLDFLINLQNAFFFSCSISLYPREGEKPVHFSVCNTAQDVFEDCDSQPS